ncbi:hypothetical protein [Kitasatospora sp. DSM 101779]|uniref:hypothetical protein n=1 Tax=Kitasatospora sp. DSM 101779 TaxID=2853165 RepID=UPI0021D8014F|nr:hypothetical protein [Kitasatospora sp. DSM 101779]MCU7823923.1 hypothetical protein [Kitasatospora sp. DSM 101779]
MTDDQPGSARAENELRTLLHRAVATVEPDPTALGRIRHAVPRRRARRRNAWTGAVAATLLAAAAVPALHAVRPFDLSGGTTAGSTDAHGADRTPRATRGSTGGPRTAPLPAHPDARPTPSTGTSGSAVATDPGSSTASAPVSVPACLRTDLGRGTAHVDPADSAGSTYGFFTVRNTSARSCGVTGPGIVAATAGGPADQTRIKVVDHIAGDAATALPAPGPVALPMVLRPGEGYRVRFGWVPEGACPSSAPRAAVAAPEAPATPAAGSGPVVPAAATTDPSPSPTPTADPPSVTVAHTPVGGDPTAASTVITGSCGGTVYRTAPEAVPAESATATATPGKS